ncbi:hypothetical protein DL93DRAFT_1867706 [Clavulina sp. PMI_390]|nr:hypothetical protein DL93DRAFT_1867706 [Clavulina sp. PMI_390]
MPARDSHAASRETRLQKISDLVQTIQVNETKKILEAELCSRPLTSLLHNVKRESRHLEELEGLLFEHQAAVQRDIAHLHNSVQPIFRSPTEVLARIGEIVASFSDGTIISSPVPSYVHLHLSKSFLSLNLVCRRFRQIATETPRCWTEVVILITDEFVTTAPLLEEHLRRSKACPFTITIYMCAPDEKNSSFGELTELFGTYTGNILAFEVSDLLMTHRTTDSI